jgi:hypothetical protein
VRKRVRDRKRNTMVSHLVVEVSGHDGVLYLALQLHAFIVAGKEVEYEGEY